MTGASGFVGQTLCSALISAEYSIRAVVRSAELVSAVNRLEVVTISDIGANTEWPTLLKDVDCIVHCAGHAHVMGDKEAANFMNYRAVNVEGTRRLAEQAVLSDVKRLVYISSIKVNGEQTPTGVGFTADDIAKPVDPYGISKWEAEKALFEIGARTGLEVVIIRPPLVYGPGVKGNFYSMLKWLSCGIPLPLGAIHNMRSLVGIDNLVYLIITCIHHPAAANQTFLVSDGEDLSTTELLHRLGKALYKPSRLLPVSASALELTAQWVGKRAVAQRLVGNLQVDISKTRKVLGWSPPVSVDEGLKRTADWYLKRPLISPSPMLWK